MRKFFIKEIQFLSKENMKILLDHELFYRISSELKERTSSIEWAQLKGAYWAIK